LVKSNPWIDDTTFARSVLSQIWSRTRMNRREMFASAAVVAVAPGSATAADGAELPALAARANTALM
jgi:hypothetical protein